MICISALPKISIPLCATLLACAGPRLSEEGDTAGRSGGVNGIIIDVARLPSYGTLLSTLGARVSGMQVQRTAGCPEIQLRGRKSISGVTSPRVYVGGQEAANTCILEMLTLADVERVEVYPSGKTHRPGYLDSPGGLILVFMKDGS